MKSTEVTSKGQLIFNYFEGLGDFKSKTRKPEVSHLRQLFFYVMFFNSEMTLKTIAKMAGSSFRHRDVQYSVNKITAWRKIYNKYEKILLEIENKIQ